MAPANEKRRAAEWVVLAFGVLLILIGLVLAGGGMWLSALGGSWYYLLAGLGLLISGALIALGRPSGIWVYCLVFVCTLAWALWEVRFDGWALVPRVFAPGVLLVLALLCAPVLLKQRSLFVLAPIGMLVVAAVFFGADAWGEEHSTGLDRKPSLMQEASVGAVSEWDWPAYGGGAEARKYAPLDQINRNNVDQLKRVWTYHTRDLPSEALKAKGDTKYAAETTPIKVGESLYLCSAKNILISVDAGTGKERWRYDPHVSDDAIPYSATCRGVAYYQAPGLAQNLPCAKRIIEGTLDARLIAVDANTGRLCSDFGVGGQVNLLTGIGETVPSMYAVTGPPTIVRGVAVVGAQVLDGQRRDAPSGVIRGYDAVTGALRWAWDMGQRALTGTPPPGQAYSRGTPNMWTIASGDEALGLVYLPMGGAAVDYYGVSRTPAEDNYSTSLVALDVAAGKPAWRFQTVHHDLWDYDLGSQASLIDFPTDAGPVPALLLSSKQGEIYVLDRRTGHPLVPVVERPTPRGGVEPERLSPTQPFSQYHSLKKPALRERDMWGMSPLDQLWCRIQYRRAVYHGVYTPPEPRPFIEYPGYNGGSDWGGIAVDPRRGVVVANYNDLPNYDQLISRAQAQSRGLLPVDIAQPGGGGAGGGSSAPQAGTPFAILINAGWRVPVTKLSCKQPPLGGIRAIDLKSGRTLWDQPFGEARANGPFGIPSGLPLQIGTPNNGGAVVTAGGLIFIAASTDNLIRAIDIDTGEVVWSDELPAGGQATPLTYQTDGRQFVVVMAGGHHFMETPIGDALVAYSLPLKELPRTYDIAAPGGPLP